MNWQTILNYFLTGVGTIATIATVLSAMVKKDSALGQWLAWFASMPIRHMPTKPPPAPPAALVALLIAATCALSTGCINRSVIQTNVQKALVFEDKVHTQVVVLETVFESAVMFLPPDKRAEATAKLEQAELILQETLDAKDNALQAALEATNEQVDLATLIPPIVKAIESIIAIVADVRSFAKSVEPRAVAAMPDDDVLELQREKLRQLAGALK